MRHAKSSWEEGSLKDFDRPLNDRGIKDAPRMGRYLEELGIIPDNIICSPALRAKQTILSVAEVLGLESEKITWDEDLYFRGAMSYIQAIKRVNGPSSAVLIAGHYPMVSDVVSTLIGQELRGHFSTATIACVEVNIESWDALDEGTCKLMWMVKPRELK